jgi:hypothetical protein
MKESIKRFETLINDHEIEAQDRDIKAIIDRAIKLAGGYDSGKVLTLLCGATALFIADVRIRREKDLLPTTIQGLKQGVPFLEEQLREEPRRSFFENDHT